MKAIFNTILLIIILSMYTSCNKEENTNDIANNLSDNKIYKTIKIGDQVWMTDNLVYLPSVNNPADNSMTEPKYYVYGYMGDVLSEAKATENFSKYGVLYNYSAAIEACPNGWHLPSDSEWEQLAQYVSEQKGPFSSSLSGWKNVGMYLKATSGWELDGNGTDDFGFNGLPGGRYERSGTTVFGGIGGGGRWWSATEVDNDNVRGWSLSYSSNNLGRWDYYKQVGFSVRCVKD